LRAIHSALSGNVERRNHNVYTKAHAETLSSTIHALSATHNDQLTSLQSRISKESQNGKLMMDKLALASSEIENTQEAYRISMARAERLEAELLKAEDIITKERSENQIHINSLQKDLIVEREVFELLN
jgi:hypothetical protein